MRAPRRCSIVLSSLIVLLGMAAGQAAQAQVKKTVDFELDQWYDFEATSGPVTLHRVRIKTEKQNIKSKLFRPGNAEYLQTIVIEMEFSNDSTRDIEADVFVEWLDSSGRVIDGYNDEEDFDEDERHEVQTVTLSTLKYGLEVAKKLKIDISW